MTGITYFNHDGKYPIESHLHHFLRGGGKFLSCPDLFKKVMLHHWLGSITSVLEYLFISSEPLLLDDLSSMQRCILGIASHVDARFRDRLKKEIASYRSPYSSNRSNLQESMFEAFFGIDPIVSLFHTLGEEDMYMLLSALCRTGSVSMVNILLDFGIDLNGRDYWSNPLGNAAARGHLDVVHMLLKAGANGALAINCFLTGSTNLSDHAFKHLLELLVDNSLPFPSTDFFYDPLMDTLNSDRALALHPKAPEILMDRNIVDDDLLGGQSLRIGYWEGYMDLVISKKLPNLVLLLLQRSHQITNPDYNPYYLFDKKCSSLTMAVQLGSSCCANVLIQDGADITSLDADGRSIIELAKTNAFASHPRFPPKRYLSISLLIESKRHRVSAKEDHETLAVIKRAFNERFKETMKFEDYVDPVQEVNESLLKPQKEDKSSILHVIEKALRLILTHEQLSILKERLKDSYLNMKQIWSLPFSEALIMRFLYVLSYALLLSIEVTTFVKGKKQLRMPSRKLLSVIALMILPFAWGYLDPSLFASYKTTGSPPES